MIKGYNGFLLEKFKTDLFLLLESDAIYASGDFLMKLKSLSKQKGNVGDIATALLDTIEEDEWLDDKYVRQNYFDVTDKDDMLSFLQSNKVPKDWDSDDDPSLPYTISGRNEIKVGKIVRLLSSAPEILDRLDFKPTDKDFEEFVNAYKASKVSNDKEFRLVSGDDIAKYYQSKHYFSSHGALGGSCMADEDKSTFKVYTENPKKVQLLILVDSNDKVHGRALIWKLKDSPCEAKYFMDRVYTNADSDVYKFKQFAEEKGFLHKQKNNSYIEDNIKFIYKGNPILGEVKVKLDGDFKEYPFIDTMCFLSKKLGDLSNIPSKDCYFLHSVSGDCDPCSQCDGEIFTDDDEYCSDCGLGIEELERAGIETKISKKLKK